jgi:amidophosphoribosyltransferase
MQEIHPYGKEKCSFEFYFSRGRMLKYIKKEKFRRLILPAVLSAIEQDTDNTVFLIFQIRLKLLFTV